MSKEKKNLAVQAWGHELNHHRSYQKPGMAGHAYNPSSLEGRHKRIARACCLASVVAKMPSSWFGDSFCPKGINEREVEQARHLIPCPLVYTSALTNTHM